MRALVNPRRILLCRPLVVRRRAWRISGNRTRPSSFSGLRGARIAAENWGTWFKRKRSLPGRGSRSRWWTLEKMRRRSMDIFRKTRWILRFFSTRRPRSPNPIMSLVSRCFGWSTKMGSSVMSSTACRLIMTRFCRHLPGNSFLAPDCFEDLISGTGFIQAIEVKAGRAAIQELPALADGKINACFQCLFRISLDRFKDLVYLIGHCGPAQRAKFDETLVIGNRQDPRDDAASHSQFF